MFAKMQGEINVNVEVVGLKGKEKNESYEMISVPDWAYLTQIKDYNYKFYQQL